MPRDDARLAVVEGVRPVIEALRAGRRTVFEVAIPAEASSPGLEELRALVKAQGIPSKRAESAREVSARVAPYPELSFEELLAQKGPRWLVGLDRVTDVGNLGSIARSAEAAGASGLVLEHRRSPPIGVGALRASAGALEHLSVGRTPNLRRAAQLALDEGLALLVAEPGGRPLPDLAPELLRGELFLILGSEDRGTRAGIRSLASATVGIPLRGEMGSLGVAAAAAYLLLRLAEIRTR